MKQFKLVRDHNYETIYNVYKKIFWFWKYIGHFGAVNIDDDSLLKSAKKIAFPKTLYFSE